MISDEELDRMAAEVSDFYENPDLVRMKRELERIVEPFRETLGTDAVVEMLETFAREEARGLGMTEEEFNAQNAAIQAMVRLRRITGRDK